MEIHAFRLTPGQDLKKSLLAYAKGAKLEAGCIVTCVGSLSKVRARHRLFRPRRQHPRNRTHAVSADSPPLRTRPSPHLLDDGPTDPPTFPPLVRSPRQVTLRLANAGKSEGNETVSLDERFEIVSLTGTVSRHGAHLHMSLADYQGNVVGGHVMEGCEVFTTAEIVLGECSGHVFTRQRDDETGFDELVVTTRLELAPPPRRVANGNGDAAKFPGFRPPAGETNGATGAVGAAGANGARGVGAPPFDVDGAAGAPASASTRKGFFGWLGAVVAPPPAPGAARAANDAAR